MSLRGDRTRASILDACVRVLVQDGVAGFSMRAAAAGAGISLGNLQHHFPSAPSLLSAVLAREIETARNAIELLLQRGEHGSRRARLVDAIVDVVCAEHTERGIRLFSPIWALAASNPDVRAALHDFYRQWVELTAAALVAAEPSLSLEDARARATLFVACAEGIALFRTGLVAPAGTTTLEADGRPLLVRILTRGLHSNDES